MHSNSPRLTRTVWPLTIAVLLAATCVAFSGCAVSSLFGRFPGGAFGSVEPCVLPPNASMEELVSHLNANIAKIQSWRSTDVGISVRGPGALPIKLSAVIAVERSRNFRLRARALGRDEADFGANAERCWFWTRRGKPNYVVTVRHDDLSLVQQRMPIPFQPDWLMEALGVVPLDADEMTLERHGTEAGTATLISDRLAPDGRPVRQRIQVDTCRGVIKQHSLHDAEGRLIARATLKDHETDAASGAILPRRIDLYWPQANSNSGLTLLLELDTIEVNPANIPQQTWQLPQIPGSPVFDMGQRLRRHLGQTQRVSRPDTNSSVPSRPSPQPQSDAPPPWDASPPLQQAGSQEPWPRPLRQPVDTAYLEEPPFEDEAEPPKNPPPASRPPWLRGISFRRR